MDNFDLRKYLAEGRLLKENKYDIDDPNSPLGQLNDNDQDVAILNNMTKKYGKDVVLMWMSSGEYGDREYFEEGKLLKEEIMVDTTIMFGGNDYIKDVLTSPDDFGFDVEDARWIKSNILTAPKTMSIEDYMALEDEWVKQANLDVGTGADRESVLDAIDVHVKQGLITSEEGETAKKIALNF